MLRAWLVGLATCVGMLAAMGCGSHTSSFECCLNGQYYSCADQAQFDTCHLDSTNNACTRDPSKDPSCG